MLLTPHFSNCPGYHSMSRSVSKFQFIICLSSFLSFKSVASEHCRLLKHKWVLLNSRISANDSYVMFYTLILNLQLCVPVSSFNQDFYQMSLLSWHFTFSFWVADSYIFSDFFFCIHSSCISRLCGRPHPQSGFIVC